MSRRLWGRLEERVTHKIENFAGVAGISVMDLKRGDAVSVRGSEEFPTASTIKIHILTQLLSRGERGEIDLNERVRIKPQMCGTGSGVIHYMEGEPELSVLDIAILMIIVSDNTATNMCIMFRRRTNLSRCWRCCIKVSRHPKWRSRSCVSSANPNRRR